MGTDSIKGFSDGDTYLFRQANSRGSYLYAVKRVVQRKSNCILRSTKYIPIGAEYYLVKIEKIRILLHEDYYPIGKEFPFVGTGQYIFSKTGEEKETLIFSDNDYTFLVQSNSL